MWLSVSRTENWTVHKGKEKDGHAAVVSHLATSLPSTPPSFPQPLAKVFPLCSLIKQMCYGCTPPTPLAPCFPLPTPTKHVPRCAEGREPPPHTQPLSHPIDRWGLSPGAQRGQGTKPWKEGQAQQGKHLLLIVIDCIIKMMFFFCGGALNAEEGQKDAC